MLHKCWDALIPSQVCKHEQRQTFALACCRKVALAHHPDKLHQDLINTADKGGTFVLVKHALELLSDPVKRS